MNIKNATLNDNKLIIEVNTLKLKSKQYKHGYYNNKDGIWLYDQNHVRKQLACFHLSKITVNKETTETNWINQWKQDVTLTFNTTENDEINLTMDGDYSPNFNTAQFCENFDYLFSTCYKTQPPIKNFHEYIIILLHEFYHEFNRELYSLYNNIPLYTLNAEGTICQKSIKGTITILDSKNQAVTDGTLTATCGEHTAIKDITTEYETTNNTIYDWSIQSQEDENITLTYTNKHGLTASIELDKNGLPILPTSEIIMDDVTMQYEDTTTLDIQVTSSDGSIVNEGEITTLDIIRVSNDQRTARINNTPIINGVCQVLFTGLLKPDIYRVEATYQSEGGYENSTGTATLTVNKAETRIVIDEAFITVDGVAIIDGYITNQNNEKIVTTRPAMALKVGGKTTLINPDATGRLPEYTALGGYLHQGDYDMVVVSGSNEYRLEKRETIQVTKEAQPLWNLQVLNAGGNYALQLTTTGIMDGTTITASIDDSTLGQFTVEDTSLNDGSGTSIIQLPMGVRGEVTVTLSATLADNNVYTEDFNLTI